MNNILFSQRLQECRKRKYSSQQSFADAYMKRYGLIRQSKKSVDNNMFGTIQAWEQGKSTPTATVLANICELLECDADYLLGRIDYWTHDISAAQRYTGLSLSALEQLHEYRMILAVEPDWSEIRELEENWTSHKYYKAYALYLIDELLTGSASHKLSVGIFDRLLTMIYEGGIETTNEKSNCNESETHNLSKEEIELLATQTRDQIDLLCYRITNSIRDILYENANNEKLPDALRISESNHTYFFSIYD